MFQRRRAVGEFLGQPACIVGHRHGVGPHDRPALALLNNMGQIERQSVAYVNARVQLITRVQRQGLTDAGLEVQVMSENAATERTGRQDAVAGSAPPRRAVHERSLLPTG